MSVLIDGGDTAPAFHVEGRNYVLDFGIPKSVDLLPDIAADLVRRNVNILVASGTPAVLPTRNATNTIPVVIISAVDPICAGRALAGTVIPEHQQRNM